MARHEIGDRPVPGHTLVRFLGRGGFGEVWEVSAPGGARAALKIITLDGKEGRKEFRAIRLVKHIRYPHLVPINSLWLTDAEGNLLDESLLDADDLEEHGSGKVGQPHELYIAMGLGDKNLLDRLRECKQEGLTGIPLDELLAYLEDAAKGIDYLNRPIHDLGQGPIAITHCDIKPQNIMLVGDSAQICDFGLARAMIKGDVRKSVGTAMTIAYAAPECLSRQGPGPRTDQYSLAVSYYELRTGELPFAEDSTMMDIMQAHTLGRLELSRLPPAERQVIRVATSIRPEDRFESAVKMVRALRRAISGDISVPELADDRGRSQRGQDLQPGQEIGLGYVLNHCFVKSGNDEVWKGTASDGKQVGLIIRRLPANEGGVDLDAMALLNSSALYHPHVTELLAAWMVDEVGQVYIGHAQRELAKSSREAILVIAGYLSQSTVLSRLDKSRESKSGMPLPDLIEVVRECASALDFLNARQHAIGQKTVSIQHLNVRPVNILWRNDGHWRLGNFAYSRTLEGDYQSMHHPSWRPNHAFVAPEVLSGYVSRWSDQYSLGLTYLQLRLGLLPFDAGDSTSRLLSELREGPGDLTKMLSSGEANCIARATAIKPEDRYPTSGEFVDEIERVLRALPEWPESVRASAEQRKAREEAERNKPDGLATTGEMPSDDELEMPDIEPFSPAAANALPARPPSPSTPVRGEASPARGGAATAPAPLVGSGYQATEIVSALPLEPPAEVTAALTRPTGMPDFESQRGGESHRETLATEPLLQPAALPFSFAGKAAPIAPSPPPVEPRPISPPTQTPAPSQPVAQPSPPAAPFDPYRTPLPRFEPPPPVQAPVRAAAQPVAAPQPVVPAKPAVASQPVTPAKPVVAPQPAMAYAQVAPAPPRAPIVLPVPAASSAYLTPPIAAPHVALAPQLAAAPSNEPSVGRLFALFILFLLAAATGGLFAACVKGVLPTPKELVPAVEWTRLKIAEAKEAYAELKVRGVDSHGVDPATAGTTSPAATSEPADTSAPTDGSKSADADDPADKPATSDPPRAPK